MESGVPKGHDHSFGGVGIGFVRRREIGSFGAGAVRSASSLPELSRNVET
jgi:hypothetical protein